MVEKFAIFIFRYFVGMIALIREKVSGKPDFGLCGVLSMGNLVLTS